MDAYVIVNQFYVGGYAFREVRNVPLSRVEIRQSAFSSGVSTSVKRTIRYGFHSGSSCLPGHAVFTLGKTKRHHAFVHNFNANAEFARGSDSLCLTSVRRRFLFKKKIKLIIRSNRNIPSSSSSPQSSTTHLNVCNF